MLRKILILAILIFVVLSCGCSQKNKETQSTQPEGSETATPQKTPEVEVEGQKTSETSELETTNAGESPDTCGSLGGDVCEAGEECTGEWLDASDTFSCCSKKCEYEGDEEILTIEPFETIPENEELGELT